MKNTHEDHNTPLSTINSLIITYYLEISKLLPNPPNYKYLSLLSPLDLISSLQLTLNNLIEISLSNQQTQYETVLRQLESQIRTQYKVLNQMKIQREAMANKIASLLLKEDEPDLSTHFKTLLAQKENEILILRAENSNLKSITFSLNEQISSLQSKIEELKKKFSDYYNINFTNSNSYSNSNINIDINDISNSKVITKAEDRYAPPLKKRRKKESIHILKSNSNRNVLMMTYKNSLSPCKTTPQGSQCQTKPSVNSNNNISSDIHTIPEKGSFVSTNASRWWSFLHNNNNSNSNSNSNTKAIKRSPIANMKMNSSRQYTKSIGNKAELKASYTYSPLTFRSNPITQKMFK